MLEETIVGIKKKKELSSLDDCFVKQKIEKILQQDRKLREKFAQAKSFKEFSRSTAFTELKKLVRAELRSVYGVFDLDEKKERKTLLEKLAEKPDNAEAILKLLLLHQSSKERISHYIEIYKRIFLITGKPQVILDLGCGANPYAYQFLQCQPRYIAMDLPSEDLVDIAEFFRIEKINGTATPIDLVKEFERIPEMLKEKNIDIVFLFKVLDSLEVVKRNISGKIIDSIAGEQRERHANGSERAGARWLVVSFPTVSLGGKKHIRKERRAWFEKLLDRRNLSYEKLDIGDEVFYVVRSEKEE